MCSVSTGSYCYELHFVNGTVVLNDAVDSMENARWELTAFLF